MPFLQKGGTHLCTSHSSVASRRPRQVCQSSATLVSVRWAWLCTTHCTRGYLPSTAFAFIRSWASTRGGISSTKSSCNLDQAFDTSASSNWKSGPCFDGEVIPGKRLNVEYPAPGVRAFIKSVLMVGLPRSSFPDKPSRYRWSMKSAVAPQCFRSCLYASSWIPPGLLRIGSSMAACHWRLVRPGKGPGNPHSPK